MKPTSNGTCNLHHLFRIILNYADAKKKLIIVWILRKWVVYLYHTIK